MYCNGNEDTLFDCSRSVFRVTSYCSSHYYDLGLKCERKRFDTYWSSNVYINLKFIISVTDNF